MKPLRPLLAFPLIALSSACTHRSESFAYTVEAEAVAGLEAELERGDILLQGMPSGPISVLGTSWGRGSSEEVAAERQAGNTWQIRAPETPTEPLQLTAQSVRMAAGVDFEVDLPTHLPSELHTADGTATLVQLRGPHVVEASTILVHDVGGELELEAGYGGVRGTLALQAGDEVFIRSRGGDVALELPNGPAYDIAVWTHPDAELHIDVGGLWSARTEPGHYAGEALFADVHITIIADEGDVTLYERFSWSD